MSVISMEYVRIQSCIDSIVTWYCILHIFIVKCVNLSKFCLAHQTIVFILNVQRANTLVKNMFLKNIVIYLHPSPPPQHLLCLILQPVPLACLKHI